MLPTANITKKNLRYHKTANFFLILVAVDLFNAGIVNNYPQPSPLNRIGKTRTNQVNGSAPRPPLPRGEFAKHDTQRKQR